MIQIHAIRVPQAIEHGLYLQLLELVSQEKRNKILRYKKIHDQYRTLLGDLLVRYVLKKDYGLANEEISFLSNSFGKPFLDHPLKFFFNISHSGDWVVCITHDTQVGIDIERIQPIDVSIAERFFQFEEYTDIKTKHISEQMSYFYQIWTLKESFIKMLGKGLSIPLNSFRIKCRNQLFSIEQPYLNSMVYCKQYMFEPDYVVSACATDNHFPEQMETISLSELYENLRK